MFLRFGFRDRHFSTYPEYVIVPKRSPLHSGERADDCRVYQDLEITADDYPKLVALISPSLRDPCEQNPRFLGTACPRGRGEHRL
jgi:hypothetical protein